MSANSSHASSLTDYRQIAPDRGRRDRVHAVTAVFAAPGSVTFREVPIPDIGDNEGLLRVEACGVCGSDSELLGGQVAGVRLPLLPGHEPLGVIERLGATAARRWGVREGDRVVVHSALRCGRCVGCLTGGGCHLRPAGEPWNYGVRAPDVAPGLWGGFATHLYLAPEATVLPVSKAVALAEAAFFNPLANGIEWSVLSGGATSGDEIVVLGPGPRGLACAVAAKASGVDHVTLCGLAADAPRLRIAERLGIDRTLIIESSEQDELRERLPSRPSIAIDTTPRSSAAVAQAVRAVRDDGTVVLAGIKGPQVRLTVDLDELVLRRLTLRCPPSKSLTALRRAVHLLEGGALPSGVLTTRAYPLRGLADAIRDLDAAVGAASAVGGVDSAVDKPLHVRVEPQLPD
jgi:alcohol dehydrogenase